MKPLELQYNTIHDTDGGIALSQLNVEATLQTIIDRVNDISAIVEPKIIATTVTSYDEFGLKGTIAKIGATPIKKFKAEDIAIHEMYAKTLDYELRMSKSYSTLEEAEAARDYLLNLWCMIEKEDYVVLICVCTVVLILLTIFAFN